MRPTGGTAAEAQAFAFPWDAAMALALNRLGWTPAAFWAATPRELAAAAGPRPAPAATRADLDRLVAAHPDPC
ncbi:phage tail assembly chaperone [Methylobacterium organophilum]|uniref:phage tail assembly chaperone n=1 Tax=Methylobacterium organophilum TaxID=410 RepID=UPI003B84AE99